MLEDSAWVDEFLEENIRRLRYSYELLSGALRTAHIPFVEADSAMFCWVRIGFGIQICILKH